MLIDLITGLISENSHSFIGHNLQVLINILNGNYEKVQDSSISK